MALAIGGMHLISGTSCASGEIPKPDTARPVSGQRHERHHQRQPALHPTPPVAARDLIAVLPQTTGLQIKQILVEAGDVVKTGQVMAVLDNSVELNQAMESSQAVVRQKTSSLGSACLQSRS